MEARCINDQSYVHHFDWSDVDMMRSILLFLNTQSWQDSEGILNDDDNDDRFRGVPIIRSAIYQLSIYLFLPYQQLVKHIPGADKVLIITHAKLISI